MKKILALLLTAAMVCGLASCGQSVGSSSTASASGSSTSSTASASGSGKVTTVGFIYIGNDSQAYTANFIAAQTAIEKTYGDKVKTLAKYDVSEDAGAVTTAAEDLISAGCNIIFSTSFGFGETIKEIAAQNPDVQFCQATCADANEETVLTNYYNYMGAIYQGRYVAGIIAGMKMEELIKAGTITEAQAKVGYVAAYPYAEPISGYTAFFLGVRSIVPTATMEVMYANSWGDYETEKQLATTMIEDGCVIISQHSDTEGPAEACEEESAKGYTVFHVGYNQSMIDIAPKTSLGGCRINWDVYEVAAVGAVIDGKSISDAVTATGATVKGQDSWGGFAEDWVEMLDLNSSIVASGTADAVNAAIKSFKDGTLKATDVFKGDYTGVNPYKSSDTVNLANGYDENSKQSAPSFGYVLNDVITVLG